jgi:RND family efflux transporter MFP subunit
MLSQGFLRYKLPKHAIFLLCAVACTTSDASSRSAPTDSTVARALADSGPKASLAPPVITSPARDGDLVLLVTTTGQVRADAAVKVRPEVGGTVATIRVRPGDAVTHGQTLVTLDPYPFDLAVREAQATADEAEQRLFESYVPESLVTGHAPSPAQRKALVAKSGLSGARLKLERARFEQTHATITSPFDGRIDGIDIATGERVTPGQALLTVVDTRHLRIEAQVLEHDLPLVHVGGDARVTSAGAPGRVIVGRIDAVLPLVDSTTRSGRALVRVTGDGTLKPGMYADVQLEATRLPARRLVPARAVIERDGRPLVFVVKDGRAQWTYITPGRSNGRETEVLPDSSSGLIPVQPGDAIIVDGQLTLTHDAPVKVMPVADSIKGGKPDNGKPSNGTAARATGGRP